MIDTLIFSHANGFPLPVYRRLFSALQSEFDCSGVMRFGHDPARPPTVGWPYLVDELVEFVQAMPHAGGRIWLAGHSLGGYLSVLAAERLQSHVRGVVLLDSPVIAGLSAAAVRIGRVTGMDRWMMPIRQTRVRCREWPDTDAAHAHYAAKRSFARWHPDVLRDYANYGTVPTGRGARELLFDRDIELRIYRSLPTARIANIGARMRTPIAFIGGRQSREVRYIGLRATRALVGDRLYWVEGSHLFPMEAPDATAERIRTAIDRMRGESDVDATSIDERSDDVAPASP